MVALVMDEYRRTSVVGQGQRVANLKASRRGKTTGQDRRWKDALTAGGAFVALQVVGPHCQYRRRCNRQRRLRNGSFRY